MFRFFAVPLSQLPCSETKELIDETDNDMGHLVLYALSYGYYIEIINNGHLHRMFAKSDFSSVEAHIQWDDVNAGNALSSLIRVAYAQAILRHDAVSIHASAVFCNGQAYLFLGKSGTGKSTHSALWIENIPGTELLNDDNPTIRILNGKAYAYGSPWSGKTACYKNVSFPVGGMVRLNQASENSFQLQEGADAFVALYPGCSFIARDEHLRNSLYDTLTVLAGSVTVGTLDCLPDKDAALMCNRELTRKQ
ncbi:MAG: phosphoenolpyruvate carboxykinase [Xylanibacter rarus]